MRNTTYDKLEHLYQKFRGYISTQKLIEEGFTNRQIAFLVNEDYLEKVCHGYYWMMRCEYEKPFDYKCIEVCLSNPRAVISMESACYYQKMIKTEPEVLTVATERTDRSAMKMKFPVERHYFSSSNFEIGVERVRTELGNYNIYNIERSLCDMIRFERKAADYNVVTEIFDSVKAQEERSERIMRYAKLLKIKNLQ
ncbi:MAG: type IV toxin-antitoxin system AbiEi family antitoxin domain-containing protein [Lachnospiraceae bacterium]|nr:type IV toxin-antitoxin system AbiEi family antitoxin domain-containing protein [Lachnospiraceae bacterium]